MARKSYKPEEMVAKLRQVDVLRGQGMAMVDAIRQIGVSIKPRWNICHRNCASMRVVRKDIYPDCPDELLI